MTYRFETSVNADRVRAIVRREVEAGNADRLRRALDTVVENIYLGLAPGDYGRGDVRRAVLDELDPEPLP